ncbi:MAG: alcohol dehydrogenase, partial [Clostridia bacterium]|nr:alcohol dehydrogenase [Clostridia bacterium]
KDATKETKANAFISFVEDLNSKMAIPSTLPEIELCDLDELTLHAEKEGNPLYPIPKILGKEDFKEIYKKVM